MWCLSDLACIVIMLARKARKQSQELLDERHESNHRRDVLFVFGVVLGLGAETGALTPQINPPNTYITGRPRISIAIPHHTSAVTAIMASEQEEAPGEGSEDPAPGLPDSTTTN